jgi:hypothetical protein
MRQLALLALLLAGASLTGCKDTNPQKNPPPFMTMPRDMDVNIYPNLGPATGGAAPAAAPARGQ